MLLTLQARNPCRALHHVKFGSNHHSSTISWNIFTQFEVIVYETLFLPLVYLLSSIHVFIVVKLASVLPSQNNLCNLFNPHIVGVSSYFFQANWRLFGLKYYTYSLFDSDSSDC